MYPVGICAVFYRIPCIPAHDIVSVYFPVPAIFGCFTFPAFRPYAETCPLCIWICDDSFAPVSCCHASTTAPGIQPDGA